MAVAAELREGTRISVRQSQDFDEKYIFSKLIALMILINHIIIFRYHNVIELSKLRYLLTSFLTHNYTQSVLI